MFVTRSALLGMTQMIGTFSIHAALLIVLVTQVTMDDI